VRRNGELVYQDLSPAEKTLLRDLGGDIDILYNFPYVSKSELIEVYKHSHDREYGIPNLFNSIHLPKVNRNNSIDKGLSIAKGCNNNSKSSGNGS
jgi:hypothetical protein